MERRNSLRRGPTGAIPRTNGPQVIAPPSWPRVGRTRGPNPLHPLPPKGKGESTPAEVSPLSL